MGTKIKLLCLLLITLSACRGRLFRQSSSAMEGTIMVGGTFYVRKTNTFEKNQIVVFNYYGPDYSSIPLDGSPPAKMHWEKRTYRLVALSGDILHIKNGEVYVNERYTPLPPNSLGEYDVFSKVEIYDFPENPDWPVELPTKYGDTLQYFARLTAGQAEDYRERKPAILNVKLHISEYDPADTFVIRPCHSCKWSVDNFGPVKIPNAGDEIIVDSLNFKLYQNIPGIHLGKNVVKEKLYFVLGDNRHGAQDSRYIGFIAHSKMYGVVK